jgi:hypothetical protein
MTGSGRPSSASWRTPDIVKSKQSASTCISPYRQAPNHVQDFMVRFAGDPLAAVPGYVPLSRRWIGT